MNGGPEAPIYLSEFFTKIFTFFNFFFRNFLKILDFFFFASANRGFKFDLQELDDLASKYSHALRDGTQELLKQTNELEVPVLVFSAGLGDSILAVMKHEQVLYPNVKLVSNFLQYKDGYLNGFSDNQPLIHTYNKNETALKGTDYYDMVHNRQHVILMGLVFGSSTMDIEQFLDLLDFYFFIKFKQ